MHRFAKPVRALQEAANRLGVGVTTLKRLCRENQLDRWPNRKRSAIKSQINKTVDMLKNDSSQGEHTSKWLAKMQKELLKKLQD